ncbi:MAG: hypothetical protein J0L97_05165 [Alphaproteobacteria bacterium]|nr:hypothetical protein [Alphaproteobacteria bacterium]
MTSDTTISISWESSLSWLLGNHMERLAQAGLVPHGTGALFEFQPEKQRLQITFTHPATEIPAGRWFWQRREQKNPILAADGETPLGIAVLEAAAALAGWMKTEAEQLRGLVPDSLPFPELDTSYSRSWMQSLTTQPVTIEMSCYFSVFTLSPNEIAFLQPYMEAVLNHLQQRLQETMPQHFQPADFDHFRQPMVIEARRA